MCVCTTDPKTGFPKLIQTVNRHFAVYFSLLKVHIRKKNKRSSGVGEALGLGDST